MVFCRAKQTKQACQRYSLTILTVVFGRDINRFLQFLGLKIFYLESFCLSKVFIFFGVGREGVNTLARFLQGLMCSAGMHFCIYSKCGIFSAVCVKASIRKHICKSGKIKN